MTTEAIKSARVSAKAKAPAKAKRAPAKLKAATPAQNAKNKAPTKAVRQRLNLAKANAKASTAALASADVNTLLAKLIKAAGDNDSAARVMGAWMNNAFAEAMRDYRCHWSHFTAQNCRTDNEKHILARVEEIRKASVALADKRGLANVNKPWSDMRKVSEGMFRGAAPREKTGKALDKRQMEDLTRLYKAGMKEERPTETELEVNKVLGQLLVKHFKVDLSKLG